MPLKLFLWGTHQLPTFWSSLRGRPLSEGNTLTGGGAKRLRDDGFVDDISSGGHSLSVRGSRVLRILSLWLVMGLGSRFWILEGGA